MNRKDRVLEAVRASGYDALIAIKPENVFYLTSHYGRGPLLLKEGLCRLYAKPIDFDLAVDEAKGCEVVEVEDAYAELLKDVRGLNACLDVLDQRLLPFIGKGITFDPAPIYSCRKVKEESEVEKVKRAAGLLDELFSLAFDVIEVGKTEDEVMAELVKLAVERGSGFSYGPKPFIVASGPASAYPHAFKGRRIGRGEFVIVDVYLKLDGYFADATRTFHTGNLSEEEEDVYYSVLEAQEEAIKDVREGKSCGELDGLARRYLRSKGYEQFFVHALGHGVGLEVHEPPWLRKGSKDVLERGNTITVEPGVYMKGRFGVRIEDTVLVRDGAKPLTKFTKEPLIV